MTTVAYRDGIMACDSQLVGGFKSACPTKIISGPKFTVGFAGSYTEGYLGAMYLSGEMQDRPDVGDYDNEYVVTDCKGIWFADSKLRMAPIQGKFFACGSGSMAAMTAMHMGATAREAVKMAILVDEYSGGKIHEQPIA